MSKTIVFIQVHGQPGIAEAELSPAGTVGDLHDALGAAGVTVDPEVFIFVDDAADHVRGAWGDRVPGLKHGCRIHMSRCPRITATINFMEKSAEHPFAPGARLRAVKEWAVDKFKMNPTDAGEHVLQLCNSTDRPASDTPLHQLLKTGGCNGGGAPGKGQGNGHGHHPHCTLCFDLVPEKRVEG